MTWPSTAHRVGSVIGSPPSLRMQQEATTGNNLPTGWAVSTDQNRPRPAASPYFSLFQVRGLHHCRLFPIVSPVQASGHQIRRKREESGCGLTEFATCIGISASYLSRVERDLANPSPTVLRLIAEELHRRRRARAVISEITDPETEAPP
ncbi:helix-turn-helix domain-containing protein [Streptomyces aquilus]|uniref:helix-turn-helix domain-containing protein n=1 Tax=Streptomyces aquilus TaxID=2548456 RepID=UPI0037D14704